MSDAIAALSDAMRNDAETLRVIGQNVANLETTAYRREVAVLHPTFEQATDDVRASLATPLALETFVDQRPGTLKSTSEALHLAVEGPGFFVIETPQGEALTRRGDFRLDNDGRLVTQAGLPVLGEGGVMHLAGTPQIAPDGTVRVAGEIVDTVRLAQVAPESQLTALGGDLYRAATFAEPDQAGRVRQGFLEASNVESVQEMVRLIETMRHFETVQRFVRGYDDMVGKAISELGKV
ncbi:MAG TPA: flagellar hook-basal body protein [Steroidobacteraceae bacterium]|jgi:flagellar basal-body rod protein FlgG|nr:flagellar hook-basal body protein [Steroidobacteraceae bacterium]